MQAQAQPQAGAEVVVTAAPSIDAQRLADALRVYLDEFGIRVGDRARPPRRAICASGSTTRAQLGEAVRAVAVVRAEHGARGDGGDRAHRSGDRQGAGRQRAAPGARRGSVPRARAQDPGGAARDAVGGARGSRSRVVDRPPGRAGRRSGARRAARAGARAARRSTSATAFVSFPVDGPPFGGLAVRASWRRASDGWSWRCGTAALGSASASNGTVDGDGDDRPRPAHRARACSPSGGPSCSWDRASRRPTSGSWRPAPPPRSGRRCAT